MINIGIRYYTDDPNKQEVGPNVDKCAGILDKVIQVSEIDDNVLKFIDVEYTEGATISVNNITTKEQCQRVINVLETIKNNLQ